MDGTVEEATRIKTVAVGYGGVGKTCMYITFATGQFPEVYVPTVFENYLHEGHTSKGQPVELALWDNAGGEDYCRLRPLTYPDTDVFILCFSVENEMRGDLRTLKSYWYKEIHHFAPNVPIILVGTKIDVRDDENQQNAVSTAEGRKLADEINAMYYMEISSLRHEGLIELFQRVIDVGYEHCVYCKNSKKHRVDFWNRSSTWNAEREPYPRNARHGVE